MAQLGQVFDSTAVEPSAPRDILPPGKYTAQIVRSEMKETSTGGQMLVLELEILDGEYANRHVWDRLNLVNNNPKAVEIAQQTLSAICRATGQLQVADSEQLHMKPLVITVAVRPAQGQYGPGNDVKGYAPRVGSVATTSYTPMADTARSTFNGGAAAAPGRVNGGASAAPAPAASTPPWRRTTAA